MTGGPSRYAGEEWERSKREALAGRNQARPAVLIAGVVEMSLRGTAEDKERVLAWMRSEGMVVWRADSSGTRAGNEAGYSYFTVEVPPEG